MGKRVCVSYQLILHYLAYILVRFNIRTFSNKIDTDFGEISYFPVLWIQVFDIFSFFIDLGDYFKSSNIQPSVSFCFSKIVLWGNKRIFVFEIDLPARGLGA